MFALDMILKQSLLSVLVVGWFLIVIPLFNGPYTDFKP